jgi:hypothetical protein
VIASDPRAAAVFAAAILTLALEAQAESQPAANEIALSASRLSFTPNGEEVEAEGDVRIDADGLELRASRAAVDLRSGAIRLDAPFSLKRGGLELRAASGSFSDGGRALRLVKPEILRLAPPPPFALRGERLSCDGGTCSLLRGVGTACPHRPSGYALEADEIVFHPSGDIDLTRPVLRIGGAKVAALPWMRLRPPSEPGFLAPRLGYSQKAGLIAGPAGHVPLGSRAFADGYIAGRTADGFEDGTRLHAPGADLRIEHVFSAPDGNSGRARLALGVPLAGAALAVDADAVTERRVLADTIFDPLERAVSRTESRLLFSLPVGSVLWESALSADQPLAGARADGFPGFETRASIRGSLVALPSASHLWPALDLALDRRDASSDAVLYDARGAYALPHTRLSAEPSLRAPFRLGPLSGRLSAASRHAVWLVDEESAVPPSRHDVGAAAELSLPLIGSLAGLPHLVTPRVAYRVLPFSRGDSPPWAFDRLDRAREGHAVEAGMSTALDPFGASPIAELSLAQRVFLPGLGEGRAVYLFARAGAGAPWLRFSGEIAWDQREGAVSAAAAGLRTEDERGDAASIDARWYGRGDGPHLDGRWDDASSGWLGDGAWLGAPAQGLELAEAASAVVARIAVLSAGARVAVFPRPGLDALWYGVAFRSECGCAELGLKAAHRLDTPVPDVMLTFVLK